MNIGTMITGVYLERIHSLVLCMNKTTMAPYEIPNKRIVAHLGSGLICWGPTTLIRDIYTSLQPRRPRKQYGGVKV